MSTSSDDDIPAANKPGHPAASTPAVPSAGEQLSRGVESLAVPGDEELLRDTADQAPDRRQ